MKRSAALALTTATLVVAICGSLAIADSSAHAAGLAETGKPPPPGAWTTEAEGLEGTDEQLSGIIDPRGVPTAYHFQLGTTRSYGRVVSGSRGTYDGNRRYEVGATAFGLRPGVTYHYRIVGVGAGGTTYGADKTFETSHRTANPRSVIACFQKRTGSFVALARPRRCDFRGTRESRQVDVSVKGMRWGHWGFNPTRAAHGTAAPDGSPTRIIAYRPVACDDGRTWYSRVTVFDLLSADGFVLRLPTCIGATAPG